MTELEKRLIIRDRIAHQQGKRAAWHYETIYLRTGNIKFLNSIMADEKKE